MALIELREVSKRFETVAGPVVALESATLVGRGGELLVVLGPSGQRQDDTC